ncbi:MAG: type I 3-dehydroquinate dehydratase [Thermoproteota archaeon]|nr:type I 3-dehydroquinate dehydratase [Thermoproteota archaeon]MDQ4101168.1 type I 3-dehydroquinate dehydratase [Thermoproteota archaeon]
MPPRVCVSIAPDDADSLTKRADLAFSFGADYVEVRFDFVKPDLMSEAIEAATGIKDRSVFTLRTKSQGGMFTGSEKDRLQWLVRLAEEEPMLLDVELATLQKNDDLADMLESKRNPLLVSWHDFERTPPNETISDILLDMRTYSNYVKIVTTARSIDDSLRLLELYDTAIGLFPIFFAMGEAGVLSRVLCTLVSNAPFTYASLDKALAPGQLTVQQMKQLYGKIRGASPV